jgi:hypothetical protein
MSNEPAPQGTPSVGAAEVANVIRVGQAVSQVGAVLERINRGVLPLEYLNHPTFVGAVHNLHRIPAPRGVHHAVNQIQVAAEHALKLRASLKAEFARRPTQVLKVGWRALADATESYEALVQHPYKGSASGLLWQIHAFRGPGSAACKGLFFSEFNLAGHDFATAAKAATTVNTGSAGAPTSGFGGIPLMAFAADAPRRADTDWAPWTTGESIVLTDTATLLVKLFNDSGGSFSGELAIFVKASPCGNLWDAHTKAFAGGLSAYHTVSRGMAAQIARLAYGHH